jgi:hypothetical protein
MSGLALSFAKGEEADDQALSLQPWTLRLDPPSVGRLKSKPDPTAVSVQLDRVAVDQDWKISLWSDNVSLEQGFEYTLTFQAKSAAPREITLFAASMNPPHQLLSPAATYSLTPRPTRFAFIFRPKATESAARFQISLGTSEADLDLTEIRLVRRPTPPELPELVNAPPRWTLSAPAEARARLTEDSNRLGTLGFSIEKDPSQHPWELNIHRAGYSFDQKKEYVARFRARATQNRTTEFLVLRDRAPWTLATNPELIPLTTAWQIFEIPFSPAKSEPRGMVQFNLGGSNAAVQIENFELTESRLDQEIDQFRFQRNIWNLSVNEDNKARLERPIHGGSAFKIEIEKATTLERWHIGFLYSPIRILEARDYLLRFRARAEGNRVISFRLDDSKTNNSLGLFKLISIGSSWQEVEVPFRSIGETNEGRLLFELGGSDIDVELANITLQLEPKGVISLDRTRSVLVNILAVSAAIVVVAFLVGQDFRRRRLLADEAARAGNRFF